MRADTHSSRRPISVHRPSGPTAVACPHLLHRVPILFQQFSCPLADYDVRSHGVARCYSRHDRSIRNSQVVDSLYFARAIHHRHGVPTHLGGAGPVTVGHGGVTYINSRRPLPSSCPASPPVSHKDVKEQSCRSYIEIGVQYTLAGDSPQGGESPAPPPESGSNRPSPRAGRSGPQPR